MKFKTIILIILAIFFLGIVIYDFLITKKSLEGLKGLLTEAEENDKNVITTISYLKNRIRPDNLNGLSNTAVLQNISNLAVIGDNNLNDEVRGIINNEELSENEKLDKLDNIFGVPSYDPFQDGLEIWYKFSTIKTENNDMLYIENVSSRPLKPSKYDARIEGQNTDNILENSSIIPAHRSNLILDNGRSYLVLNKIPSFYATRFLGMTISIWFNANPNTANASRLFILDDIGVFINNGYLAVGYHNGMRWNYITLENINVLNKKWIHVVWTIDSNGIFRIYLNNELMHDTTKYIPRKRVRKIGYIGEAGRAEYLYNGKMADFRLYERAITTEEVNHIYNLAEIKSNNLPIRKSPNLIKNGCFSTPTLNSFYANVNIANWSAGRNTLVVNIANGGYSTDGMSADIGYSSQLGLLSNFGTNFKPGFLQQTEIQVLPNTKYELSFLYSLYVHSSHDKDVYLSVKLGCYVDTGSDKSIVPVRNTWKKYSIILTTEPNCITETLRISLNSPLNGNRDTTCGITNVSLRVVK